MAREEGVKKMKRVKKELTEENERMKKLGNLEKELVIRERKYGALEGSELVGRQLSSLGLLEEQSSSSALSGQ